MRLRLLTMLFLIMTCSLSAEDDNESSEGPFTSPGVATYENGQWVGSDHLFNLSNEINVNVDLLLGDHVQLPLTQDEIKKNVEKVFEDAKLVTNPDSNNVPLPYFNMFIMVYSIPEGYAYVVEGRLFEEVKLARVVLDESIHFQAITWERQSINISSEKDFKNNLTNAIAEISKMFTDQYHYFELLKLRQKTQ
ncbi:MAG: hypothetical protein H7A37_08965 [Chlamydiales bacterium]|nr:hypothetical protein [Chlamydiia bacterium]MCP5508410.1 hypothetical protein [Chlamydiales bacterium]